MNDPIPYDLPTAAAVLALLVWCVFALRYHFTTRGAWRLSDVGRNAMFSSLVIVGLVALSVVTRLAIHTAPPEPFAGQRIVALVVYLATAGAGVQRIIVQYRAQRRSRAEVK